MKKIFIALLACCMIFAMAACSTSSSSTAYITKDGVTEGSNSISTSDKGSGKFNVKGNHVEMTNFAFDADSSLKVFAEIPEDSLVYSHVVVHDDGITMQNIADGEYTTTFTTENVADEFNNIYKAFLGASDSPVTDEYVTVDEGVFVVRMNLTDGEMIMLAKEGSNKYVALALTTAEYGTQAIIDSAFDSLK